MIPRWGWIATTVLAFGIGGITAGLVLSAQNRPPQPTEEPTRITHTIQARHLSEQAELTCALERPSQAIPAPSMGEGKDPIVTGRPSEPLSVSEGALLVEVAGRPMIVLQGPYPLYRDLGWGDEGNDVTMLQRALTRVGLSVKATGRFDAKTGKALHQLYRRHGYLEPQQASTPATPDATPESHPAALRSEILFLPAGVTELTAPVPDVGTLLGENVASFYSGDLRARCTSPLAEALKTGATVAFAQGAVTGTIESTAPVTDQESTGSEAIVTLSDGASLAVGASVTGKVVLRQTEGDVLTVPISALHGGMTTASVTVVDEAGPRDVEVTVGLVVDGFAEVDAKAPSTLEVGDSVVTGG